MNVPNLYTRVFFHYQEREKKKEIVLKDLDTFGVARYRI